MIGKPMSDVVSERLQTAAHEIGTADPLTYVKPLIDRTFHLPAGDIKYAKNSLTPGAVPLEPSFSENEPDSLRFTIEPLGPGTTPISRRDEATRQMRLLIGPIFGKSALRWFDECSEDWRGMGARSCLDYGAFFGNTYDRDGLSAAKVYYEMHPNQINSLSLPLQNIARHAIEVMPFLRPLFTSIKCRRFSGTQKVTFFHRGPLRLADLAPLAQRLGLAHQLPGLMRIMGLALGGRFELPENSVVMALSSSDEGPELKLEVMLGMLPDLPASFYDLLALGLTERPRELNALNRWLQAFTPESYGWPGNPSVLSVRITPKTPAKVTLYLRPIEFEIAEKQSNTLKGTPV